MALHTLLIINLRAAAKYQEWIGFPCKKARAHTCVTGPQSLKGPHYIGSPACLGPRLKLVVSCKDLVKGSAYGGQQAIVDPDSKPKLVEL